MKKLCLLFLFSFLIFMLSCGLKSKIDRQALVERHNPVLTKADSTEVLSVGNGNFAFSAGITGLQTFTDYYDKGVPLGTLSHWGWHTSPNPNNYQLQDAIKYYDSHGRLVGYASDRGTPAANWLRANPHRLHLGRIGFVLKNKDGTSVQVKDLRNVRQKLDMWTGVLTSYFEIQGEPVSVETYCHGERDAVSCRISSPLIRNGRLAVSFHFPYGTESWGPAMGDWQQPNRHKTIIIKRQDQRVDLERVLDNDRYYVSIQWAGGANFTEKEKHLFHLTPDSGDRLEFTCAFSKAPIEKVPDVEESARTAATFWKNYWTRGGAIDLSGSADPRAQELERRIVLSQYLVAINSAGALPPQETGLTCNSWYGKFHLEMHWWHAVQFVLWGRYKLLEKTMPWYQSILPRAQATAKFQGYAGARWPKMVGPDGREGPSSVGVFLIWQQPHPIYYAELLYRLRPTEETLAKYQQIVFQSAEFMASYAYWNEQEQRYVLGPPLIPAQEKHPAETTMNPTFELAYWAWGLETAQKWRQRLGFPRNEKWQHVIDHLSPLPIKDGLYVNAETAQNTFGQGGKRYGHPSLLAAYGMVPPNKLADPEIMRRTLKKVLQTWNWDSTWGWDFPLTAMTAARCGEPELAVEALLMQSVKNRYAINGHNFQTRHLPLYLPGNGGLLAAVAMMAAGWDGAPDVPAPGFPQDGSWTVRWEGLERMP